MADIPSHSPTQQLETGRLKFFVSKTPMKFVTALFSRPNKTPSKHLLSLLLVMTFLGTSASVNAQEGEWVDLELVLAIDLSSSVDQNEWERQAIGIAEAFRNPSLIETIQSSAPNGIAVAVVQWSSNNSQSLAVDWTLVSDAASGRALSRKIKSMPRMVGGGQTGIYGAIDFSIRQFKNSGYTSWRKVIDISGDGQANSGARPGTIRDRAIDEGVIINGLAIINEEPFVDRYFRDKVIGGSGAFLMRAEDYDDFATAILRKLIREIGPPLASTPPFGPILSEHNRVASIAKPHAISTGATALLPVSSTMR